MFEIDLTFYKVHQSACSVLKDQVIGSSRGGKNTKIYVLINERMQLLKVMLTGGQVRDSEPALALLKGIKLTGKKILADKAYSYEQIRFFSLSKMALLAFPTRSISGLSMTLIQSCTNKVISSSGFFSALRIAAI